MKRSGQALIEYLFVLSFVIVIGGRLLNAFGDYVSESIGSFNVVLTKHLVVGVCQTDCFTSSFLNGRNPD